MTCNASDTEDAKPPREPGAADRDAHSIGEFMLRRLRADIIATRLRPGMKLALHPLAKSYGVGITPLRDALGQLAGDGLVIMESQKGFRVAPVSPEDFDDVCDIRLRVELMALGMAIDRGDEDWISGLRHAYEVFAQVRQKIGDNEPIAEKWERRHRAMHMALLRGCGSPTLMRFVGQTHDRVHRYRRIALPTVSYMAVLDDDHGEIAAAALERDKARSEALLRRHIASSTRLIRDNIRFDPVSGTACGVALPG